MKEPLVTVLMPVYNAEKYVGEAIESILNQTFTDFEFLIIDDGCTDKTVDIISSYIDRRIRLVQNGKNIKLIATLNKGIELARGKYICRVDADDVSVTSRLEKQVFFMENNPEYFACSSWVSIINNYSEYQYIIKYEEDYDSIRLKSLYQNHFPHPASIINKEKVKKFDLSFNSNYIHAEDYHFFLCLAELGKIFILQEALTKVRKHDTNISVLNAEIQKKNSINVIKYQLSKIGINPDTINFDLYFRFFYNTFDLSKNEIEIIENYLLYIINSNGKSNYLPNQMLINFLSNRWYHLCVNSTYHGFWIYKKFSNSKLSNLMPISKFNNFKLLIKSSFKYQ